MSGVHVWMHDHSVYRAGPTFYFSLWLAASDLGHKLGHSECLEHVICKAEYIS